MDTSDVQPLSFSPIDHSDLDEPILDRAESCSHDLASAPTVNASTSPGPLAKLQRQHFLIIAVVCAVVAIGCVVALGVVVGTGSSSPSTSQSSTPANFPSAWFRILALSDVHLDVLYNPNASAINSQPCQNESVRPAFGESAPFGRVACDSPLRLFESALGSMRDLDSRYPVDVVLVTGDKAGHNLYVRPNGSSYHGELALQAQAQFAKTLSSYFSHRQAVLTMGNNDVRYHWQIPTQSWYEALWPHWAPLILCRGCLPSRYQASINEAEFNSTFLRGAYYKIELTDKLTFLVTNTLYWTSYAWVSTKPFRDEIPVKADEQMSWLGNELSKASAAGKKVVVVGHVPPGLDPFRPDAKNVSFVRQFWFDNYTQLFFQMVGETYRDTVVCNFFAHLHKDDFHVHSYDGEATRTASLLFSSISPVYENNPAYRLMYFNPVDWYLADYTQYWADLVLANTRKTSAYWTKQYTFSEAYPGPQRIDTARLQALWKGIMSTSDSSVWHKYMANRQVFSANTLNSYSRDHLYCVAYTANLSAYASCRLQHPYEPES